MRKTQNWKIEAYIYLVELRVKVTSSEFAKNVCQQFVSSVSEVDKKFCNNIYLMVLSLEIFHGSLRK